MATHYRTRGFIIKKSDRGEADQFLTLYTENYGKLKLSAKAIRKITSKLRAGSGLFYLSEIEFIQGKTNKTLTDAILIENFKNIRQDLIKLRIAYKIADILDELSPKEEKDEKIWELLLEIFHRLDTKYKIPNTAYKIYYYFFWRLVSILGYHPAISNCSIHGREIDCDMIKILKLILKKDWQILIRLKFEPNHLRLLENISKWYNESVIRRD